MPELDLSELKKDLIELCEDNEVMIEVINDYFTRLENEAYLKLNIIVKD